MKRMSGNILENEKVVEPTEHPQDHGYYVQK